MLRVFYIYATHAVCAGTDAGLRVNALQQAPYCGAYTQKKGCDIKSQPRCYQS